MQIRCLGSASNASDLFDLRCVIREKMIAFIQENYPDAFPRTRFAAIDEGGSPVKSTENDRPLLVARG
jgi:hypothetical protein